MSTFDEVCFPKSLKPALEKKNVLPRGVIRVVAASTLEGTPNNRARLLLLQAAQNQSRPCK